MTWLTTYMASLNSLEVCLITLVVLFLIGMPIFMSLAIAATVSLAAGQPLPLTVVQNSFLPPFPVLDRVLWLPWVR